MHECNNTGTTQLTNLPEVLEESFIVSLGSQLQHPQSVLELLRGKALVEHCSSHVRADLDEALAL